MAVAELKTDLVGVAQQTVAAIAQLRNSVASLRLARAPVGPEEGGRRAHGQMERRGRRTRTQGMGWRGREGGQGGAVGGGGEDEASKWARLKVVHSFASCPRLRAK